MSPRCQLGTGGGTMRLKEGKGATSSLALDRLRTVCRSGPA